jgi:AraC family transcriptional regulator
VNYIEAHLEEDLSLDAIAKEVGMSKYYFCRLFKNATQLTPYQYYLQRRLIRARQFLENGQFTPTEVAYMTGFSDQNHFTRLFKRHYGITPGALKKRNAKEQYDK